MGVLTSLSKMWATAVERPAAPPPVRFAGPLSGPRVVPGPAATVTGTGRGDLPHPTRPDPACSRLVAYDCLFADRDGHRCVSSDGQTARPGGSCYASAQLMSRHDFAGRFPGLHAKAVLLRIINPNEVA